jgi:hypothetical protein
MECTHRGHQNQGTKKDEPDEETSRYILGSQQPNPQAVVHQSHQADHGICILLANAWSTVAKTNKAKLDKIQNWGFRLILGAIKTIPVKDMEKTTKIEPLENRWNYKRLRRAGAHRTTLFTIDSKDYHWSD